MRRCDSVRIKEPENSLDSWLLWILSVWHIFFVLFCLGFFFFFVCFTSHKRVTKEMIFSLFRSRFTQLLWMRGNRETKAFFFFCFVRWSHLQFWLLVYFLYFLPTAPPPRRKSGTLNGSQNESKWVRAILFSFPFSPPFLFHLWSNSEPILTQKRHRRGCGRRICCLANWQADRLLLKREKRGDWVRVESI